MQSVFNQFSTNSRCSSLGFGKAMVIAAYDNGLFDSLRALLFKPEIYTQWERLVDRAVYPA